MKETKTLSDGTVIAVGSVIRFRQSLTLATVHGFAPNDNLIVAIHGTGGDVVCQRWAAHFGRAGSLK
tara:strand:+ start:238 stop:438 length:201 start_codon:yes stop_codon:yes gene_type:complete